MAVILAQISLAYKVVSPISVNIVGMNGSIYYKKLTFNLPFRNYSLDNYLVILKMKVK